jgi:hypothetical protein
MMPDGTPVPEGQIIVQVDGIPNDASLSCNGLQLGQGRLARLFVRSGETVECDLRIAQTDGDHTEISLCPQWPGHRYIFRMRHVFRNQLVLTRIICIREDKPFFDLPRIYIKSDLHNDKYFIPVGPIASNQYRDIAYRVPFNQSVTLDLWHRGFLDWTDHLGNVTVRPGESNREGVFNLDPHQRGVLYRVFWRIEPKDTMSEDLRTTFQDSQNVNSYLGWLRGRTSEADARQAANSADAVKAGNDANGAQAFVQQAKAANDSARQAANDLNSSTQDYKTKLAAFNDAQEQQNKELGDLNAAWNAAVYPPFTGGVKAKVDRATEIRLKGISIDLSDGPVDLSWLPKPPISIPSVGGLIGTLGGNISNLHNITVDITTISNDDIQKLVQQANQAGSQLSDAEKKAVQSLADWKAAYDACLSLAAPLKHALDHMSDLANKYNVLKNNVVADDVIRAKEQVRIRGAQACAWAKEKMDEAGKEAAKLRNMLANQEVVLYHIENELQFSLNAYTGGYDATIDLGFAGIEWDTEKTKDLFRGQFTLPAVDPVSLAAASYGLKFTEDFPSQYDSAKKSLASANTHVYVASERFVHWGGPSTAARLIAASIIDGGNQATQEARQELTLEADRLYAWAALRAQYDASRILRQLFKSVLTGGGSSVPDFPKIEVKPWVVDSNYVVESIGSTFLPGPMAKMIEDQFSGVIASISRGRVSGDRVGPIPHAGFVVTWGDRSDATDQDALDRIADRLFQGTEASRAAFQDAISYALANLGNSGDAAQMRQFVSSLAVQDIVDRQLDGGMLERIKQTLNINKGDIAQWYVPGEAVIHLEGTPIGQRFEKLFSNLALGNHPRCELTKLEFDLETMTFTGRVKVVHEQSWGTLDGILKGL